MKLQKSRDMIVVLMVIPLWVSTLVPKLATINMSTILYPLFLKGPFMLSRLTPKRISYSTNLMMNVDCKLFLKSFVKLITGFGTSISLEYTS